MSVPPSYPCMACRGALVFDATAQRWRCPRCRSNIAPSTPGGTGAPGCPTCRRPMVFNAAYQAWWCGSCRHNVSAVATTPAPVAPPVCPNCRGSASYFTPYQRWFCPSCRQYHAAGGPPAAQAPAPASPTKSGQQAIVRARALAEQEAARHAASATPAPHPLDLWGALWQQALSSAVTSMSARMSGGFPTRPGGTPGCGRCGKALVYLPDQDQWFCAACREIRAVKPGDGQVEGAEGPEDEIGPAVVAAPARATPEGLVPRTPPSGGPRTVAPAAASPRATGPGGDLAAHGALQFERGAIVYRVLLLNRSSEPVLKIKIQPHPGPGSRTAGPKHQEVPVLEPGHRSQVSFPVIPDRGCREVQVAARVEFYDAGARRTRDLTVAQVQTGILPPSIRAVPVEDSAWRTAMEPLTTVEETKDGLPLEGPAVFDLLSDVLRDMNLFALEPKVTKGERLFRGVQRFHGLGESDRRYGVALEVLGGTSESRLILRVYAQGPDALAGFYPLLLEEIGKRIVAGGGRAPAVVHQHIHGDYVEGDRKDVRDSVVQNTRL